MLSALASMLPFIVLAVFIWLLASGRLLGWLMRTRVRLDRRQWESDHPNLRWEDWH